MERGRGEMLFAFRLQLGFEWCVLGGREWMCLLCDRNIYNLLFRLSASLACTSS